MNGRNDDRFNQSVEFFVALHRLGKPSWLLEYEEDGHGVESLRSMTDFTIRLKQFFDHYLMDKQASVWLTREVSDKMKSISDGH